MSRTLHASGRKMTRREQRQFIATRKDAADETRRAMEMISLEASDVPFLILGDRVPMVLLEDMR